MSITPEEARAALAAADSGRRAVADEVGVPAWYWWGLGAAWIALGVIADLDIFWLTIAVTLAFGVTHAQVFARLASGRRRTGQVQVSRAVAGPRTMLHVWLLLVALIAVTVAFALVLAADGARHPAIAGSVLPAAIVIAGGPGLVRWSARRQAGSSDVVGPAARPAA
jgi:hypothetical protein